MKRVLVADHEPIVPQDAYAHRCRVCSEEVADHFEPPVKVYIDLADWWVGYYRGPNHHYVCPLPTVVIRWPRRRRA